MFYNKFEKKNNLNNKGFTLIETLISITLFAFVVTITLTAILTILDINKKSRSLMSVMNNLNFAVDSITLSFKTGKSPSQTGDCFQTNQVNYKETQSAEENVDDERIEPVIFCITQNGITKQIGTNSPIKITSDELTFDTAKSYFKVQGSSNVYQPILFIHLVGEVKTSEKIKSGFRIQTNVSQRDLNF